MFSDLIVYLIAIQFDLESKKSQLTIVFSDLIVCCIAVQFDQESKKLQLTIVFYVLIVYCIAIQFYLFQTNTQRNTRTIQLICNFHFWGA